MSDSGPWFYAWCDEATRIDAFEAALGALVHPKARCDVAVTSLDTPTEIWRRSILIDEVVTVIRAAFAPGTHVSVDFGAQLRSGRWPCFGIECFGEEYQRRHPSGPVRGSPFDRRDLLSSSLEIAPGGTMRDVETEAAIASIQVQQDIEDLLIRLCAPEAHGHVKTGACVDVGHWGAPVETCATYHADAASVARDLALSWVHLHEGDKTALTAGMSLELLRARIDAAPHGACVGIAGDVDLLRQHTRMDWAAAASRDTRPTRVDAVRRGARAPIEGDAELTRETVLKALDTHPSLLLDALEASAVPDDDWRSVESTARETIAATKEGAATYQADVASRKHVQFIKRHAPFHVRRLPSGGAVLTTHPYRTLWPLWADALFVLGIMP
ncbi:hypothetical protein [Sorangium cellulosum]|uniref:Uncharacterized protein n=1 Tax=Sorangium cellulosum TaxID=56 RepID=A0A150Q1B8_SORCE|nr:hypothetical protein [Sorangium cellulosum]KYF61811.1 hypothetical protein BE15_14615 [Sorangium cellulosum]